MFITARFGIDLVGRIGDPSHHHIGHLVRRLGPGINDLVVFFALGDQTVRILLFIFFHQVQGLSHHLFLRRRNDHVVLAKRNAGFGGESEPQLHDVIGEKDRLFLSTVAINHVDDVGDLLFRHQLIDQLEFQSRIARQFFRQEHPTRRGINQLSNKLALFIDGLKPRLDFGVQTNRPRFQGHFDFG